MDIIERDIYALIVSGDGIKAREIAKKLNKDRSTVNHYLYNSPYMKDLCYRDENYEWYGLIRQSRPHVGLGDYSGYYGTVDHAHSSALMAFQLLREWKVPDEDIAAIVSAIGQHDEKTGTAVDAVSAALILADKTDVRRNRVRNPIKETFDIHDRVNYAAVASSLQVNVEKKVILLEIELDEEICSILDYFEIFLQRMLMCKRAAEILGLKFKMKANGNKIC